ncbi:hypothetical protein [Nocardia puris]|uniref:hypothetical protein n=1 Tax=Nocardia puris TaxID=208602 RepID=UPI002E1E39BA
MAHGNAIPSPEERRRAQQALERRIEGRPWREIADELNYGDESGPRHAVSRLLARTDAVLAAELRELEGERLDALLAAYWAPAVRGDVRSAEVVLKVLAQRVKLFGLAVPERVVLGAEPEPEDYAEVVAGLLERLIRPRDRAALESGD